GEQERRDGRQHEREQGRELGGRDRIDRPETLEHDLDRHDDDAHDQRYLDEPRYHAFRPTGVVRAQLEPDELLADAVVQVGEHPVAEVGYRLVRLHPQLIDPPWTVGAV